MSARRARAVVEELLHLADVHPGGDCAWDIQVHDERFYARVLAHGSLGLGESYMDGWWDCPQLDEMVARLLRAGISGRARSWRRVWPAVLARLANLQRPSRAFEIGRRHYDIGNDLYRRMLDRRMIYSCGYWKEATDLDQAQEAKLELTCRKLGLEPGMRLLDIGCGWGGTLRYAVERFGVTGVGITVSQEQATLGQQTCAGLPVEIRLQDYRELDERFDRILSIGMFEHVGVHNYRTYMQVVRRCLADDGVFLLHTIGRRESGRGTDRWLDRYIFPSSVLPSAQLICRAVEGLYVLEDWHAFGLDYDRTLMAWHARFESAWEELRERYDERFHRMWRFYLLTCAGAFRARSNQLWQIVYSPRGLSVPYRAPR